MDDFLALHTDHQLEGFAKRNITPYIHIFLYHVPGIIERQGRLKSFFGQGVEKNNDDAKKIFYRGSNKAKASHDILRHDARNHALLSTALSDGCSVEREKRKYRKRNPPFWT